MKSNTKFSIQLYDYKGCIDCFGNKNKEDRYIIINNENNTDEIGENFTKKEAKELCKDLNNEQNIDLFEKIETLPVEVQEIVLRYSELDNNYIICDNLVKELNQFGYTCEFGLDAIPFNLKKI